MFTVCVHRLQRLFLLRMRAGMTAESGWMVGWLGEWLSVGCAQNRFSCYVIAKWLRTLMFSFFFFFLVFAFRYGLLLLLWPLSYKYLHFHTLTFILADILFYCIFNSSFIFNHNPITLLLTLGCRKWHNNNKNNSEYFEWCFPSSKNDLATVAKKCPLSLLLLQGRVRMPYNFWNSFAWCWQIYSDTNMPIFRAINVGWAQLMCVATLARLKINI